MQGIHNVTPAATVPSEHGLLIKRAENMALGFADLAVQPYDADTSGVTDNDKHTGTGSSEIACKEEADD